jgi:hypothetical protein
MLEYPHNIVGVLFSHVLNSIFSTLQKDRDKFQIYKCQETNGINLSSLAPAFLQKSRTTAYTQQATL